MAYTITQHPPLPYRLRASSLRLQIPNLSMGGMMDSKFLRNMRETVTWRALRSLIFTFRTWSRRTIWGDRLFLRFHGPTTILLQSRASRITDVLSTRDVNEIADLEPGAISPMITLTRKGEATEEVEVSHGTTRETDQPTKMSLASKDPSGKIVFREAKNFKDLTGS